MKRILGIAMVLGLVGALTVVAQEVKPGKTGVINLGNDVKLEMLLIPAGKFKMGSQKFEKGRLDIETEHEVTLTKPYYMGKYEVTQEQWKAVMGNNPSKTKGAKFPVTDVTWEDCQEFIKKLNENTKGGYRLPTEAEWEYACRAGTSTAYSFGDSLIVDWDRSRDLDRSSMSRIIYKDANINGNSTKEVGSYKPNAFGLYDMHGNVREWCEDWYEDYPEGAVTDPKVLGTGGGFSRVLRGGSFALNGSFARSSFRNTIFPSSRGTDYGFRLARTP